MENIIEGWGCGCLLCAFSWSPRVTFPFLLRPWFNIVVSDLKNPRSSLVLDSNHRLIFMTHLVSVLIRKLFSVPENSFDVNMTRWIDDVYIGRVFPFCLFGSNYSAAQKGERKRHKHAVHPESSSRFSHSKPLKSNRVENSANLWRRLVKFNSLTEARWTTWDKTRQSSRSTTYETRDMELPSLSSHDSRSK